MMYICPDKDKCNIGIEDCKHCIPHEHRFSCNRGICLTLKKRITCIETEFIEEDEFTIC
jgi:hypothetical protein